MISRLLSHLLDGSGNKSKGTSIAIAISGIPKITGLINWSKKLRFMVSFKG